jgi:FdhD protein
VISTDVGRDAMDEYTDDYSVVNVDVERVDDRGQHAERDVLAVEEPLEIRLHLEVDGRLVRRTVSVTMRTPGDDPSLAAGFLFTEGILRDPSQVEDIRPCGPFVGAGRARNVVRVQLRPGTEVDLARLERHFYTTSSCGVCGKTSIEALQATSCFALPPARPVIAAALVHQLPELLRDAQAVFDRTGGLHASALFDTSGRLHALREDVGRHNALDKVIGAEFLAGRLPAHDRILLVSGRASFELVQKAIMAGIPVLAAVGAPSSLAVQLAASAGMTLLGFVRDGRFNVYAGAERLRPQAVGGGPPEEPCAWSARS